MGLLLGASVLSVCELLDLLFYKCLRSCSASQRKRIEVTPVP